MKLLVTGSYGQLGNELRRCLETGNAEIGPISEEYADASVDYVDYDELDISDWQAVDAWFAERGPYDVVINCAAITNVHRTYGLRRRRRQHTRNGHQADKQR